MHLDHGFFLVLIGDRPARTDAGPVKNTQVVQLALRLQQLPLTERRFRPNTCNFGDQDRARHLLARNHHLRHAYLLSFCDVVCDVDFVRILRVSSHIGFDLSAQVTVIQIHGEHVATIFRHASRRERCARAQLEPLRRTQGRGLKFLSALKIHSLNLGLRTLRDLESDVDLRFLIHHLGIDGDILESAIVVDRFQVVDALPEQLVTEAPS